MVTFFEDRVEITSFSHLAPNQTLEGFYRGHSIPVNEELSSIFLATHLSERTGKGNPLIVSRFGRGAFEVTDASIKVTIPYNWERRFPETLDKVLDKVLDKLTEAETKVLKALAENPTASQPEIAKAVGVGTTTVQKAIVKLKKIGVLNRQGSNKNGFWVVSNCD